MEVQPFGGRGRCPRDRRTLGGQARRGGRPAARDQVGSRWRARRHHGRAAAVREHDLARPRRTSTAATTSIDPIPDGVDDLGVDEGRRDMQSMRARERPSAGIGSPNSVRSPKVLRRALVAIRSARRGGKWYSGTARRSPGSPPGPARTHDVRRRSHRQRHLGDVAGGEVVGDLHTRRPGADDEYAQTRIRLGVSVFRGMQRLAGEAARQGGNDRNVLVAGRDDDVAGVDVARRGGQPPTARARIDPLDAGVQPQIDAVFVRVPVQMLDDVVAGREDRRTSWVPPARKMRELSAGVQLQPVISTAPGGSRPREPGRSEAAARRGP